MGLRNGWSENSKRDEFTCNRILDVCQGKDLTLKAVSRSNRFNSARLFILSQKNFKVVTPRQQSLLKFFRERPSQLLNSKR
jgi:hypothetical protein